MTGGSKGLGFASAASAGRRGRRRPAVVAVSGVGAAGGPEELGCRGVAADLADPTAAEALVAATVEAFGRIDGALISVGGPPAGPALGLTDEQWQGAFDSVFLGSVRVCRAVVAALPRRGRFDRAGAQHQRQVPGRRTGGEQRPAAGAGDAGEDDGRRARTAGRARQRAAARPRSTPTGSARWTARTLRSPGRLPSRASRCAATATPRSSGGSPRSCSPRPRLSSPAR